MGSEKGGRAAEAKARSLSMSIEALKEQARGHEQREEWTDALQLYLQAISRLGDEDPDMGLYNRAGDLFTRVGNVEGAIEYYEMAVELYLDAELANNAIAILKKILRNVPNRKEVYLKMGQIRAQQGFVPDARGYFLGYAERTQKEGDFEEAFRALREFCDLAPDDLEIRTALATQLQAHERTDEALSLLTAAYHRFTVTGQNEQAVTVEEQIRGLDPEYEIPEAGEEDVLGFESTSLSADRDEAPSSESGIELAADFGEINYEEEDDDDDDDEASAAVGLELEHTSLVAPAPEEEESTEGLTASDFGESDDGGRGLTDYVDPTSVDDSVIEVALPEIELGDDEAEVEVWGAASSWSDEDEEGEEEEVTELPLMDFGDPDEDDGGRWSETQETFDGGSVTADAQDDTLVAADPSAADLDFSHDPDALGGPDSGDVDSFVEVAGDFETETPREADDPEMIGVPGVDAALIAEAQTAEDLEQESTSFEFTADDLDTELYGPVSVDDADVLDSFDDAAFEPAADDLWKRDDDVIVGEEPSWSPEHALEASMDAPAEWGDGFNAELDDELDDELEVEFHAELADEGTAEIVDQVLADDLPDATEIEGVAADPAPALDADFGNREGTEGFGDGAAEAVETPETSESPDYVDLNNMVFGAPKERTTRWNVESAEPTTEADFDFQQMLAQFKEKVAENVEVGDVRAHYDLGTAFKEMGLLDEAITEFQQALRADGRNLATYEVLGQCFMDKGQPEVAVRSLTMATELPFEVEDELLGIYYYLGRAHEEVGNSDQAVEFYEKVFALDINFQDVTERLRELR